MIMGLGTIVIIGPLAWLLFRDKPEVDDLLMDGGAEPAAHNNPDMHIERGSRAMRRCAIIRFGVQRRVRVLGLEDGIHLSRHFTGRRVRLTRERIINLFVPIAATNVTTNLLSAINAKLRLKFLLLVMNLGCIAAAIGMLNLKTSVGVAAYVIGNGIASGGFVSLGHCVPAFTDANILGQSAALTCP